MNDHIVSNSPGDTRLLLLILQLILQLLLVLLVHLTHCEAKANRLWSVSLQNDKYGVK